MSIPYIYMCQDGLQISGVGSVGIRLLEHDPLCHLLFLNVDNEIPKDLENEPRFFYLPSSVSHDPLIVSKKIIEIITLCKGPRVALLPNTGDTNYGATLELIRDKDLGIKKSVTILGIIHGDQKNPYEVIRHYEASISCFAGVSTWCRDRLKEYIPHRSNQVFWLPPAAPISEPPSSSIDSRPLRLVYLGRLTRQHKCVHRLHDLAIELRKLETPFELTLIGDGPERKSLELNFKSLSFENSKIKFLGRMQKDSIYKELKLHDVILSVSSTEGSPVSILEGMGAGLCPIVMDIDSGIRDFIVPNHNGIITKQGNTLEMAEAIKELDQDRKRLHSLKSIAHNTVNSKFSISLQISKLHDLINLEADPICIKEVNELAHFMDAHVHRSVARALDKNLSECAVYGAGMYGRKLVDALLLNKVNPSVIFDSHLGNSDINYKGIPIVSPDRIFEFQLNAFVIGSVDFHKEIEDEINFLFSNSGKPTPLLINHCIY